MANKEIIKDWLEKDPTTREETIRILNEVKKIGGVSDIFRDSPLGKRVEFFGVELKSAKSIDEVVIKLKEGSKQQKKDEIKEEKEKTKKKKEEEEKKEKESQSNKRKEAQKKAEKDNSEKATQKKEKEKKDLVDQVSKNLGDDEKLKKTLEDELNKIIEGREIKTDKQKKEELSKKIAEIKVEESDTQIEMASKAMVEGAKKIEINNIDEIRKKKNEDFRREFEEETIRLNPDINEEQIVLVREQGKIIADVYYGDKGIENSRDDILNSGEVTEGAYSDVEGIINLLQKSGGEIKGIKSRYEEIKEKLSGLKNMPDKLREFKSFDGIMGVLKDSSLLDRFNFSQNRVLIWADRINKVTGGWLSRTFVNLAGRFVQKIGNEAVKVFAQNGLKMIAEQGFRKGATAMFNAFLSGAAKKGMAAGIKVGLQAGAKVAGGMMAKAGAAASAGPYGWIAAVIIIVLEIAKKLKKVFGNIAKKLGISFDIKDKLQRDYGKFGGWVLNKGYEGVKHAMLPFIIIGACCMMLLGCQQQQASTLVTPTDEEDTEEIPGNYDYTTIGDISVPICNSNVNGRPILRDIALSIENKVPYNRDGDAWKCIGPCSNWGKSDNDGDKYPYKGMDCAKFVSWVWLQCIGMDRVDELGSTSQLLDNKSLAGWEFLSTQNINSEDDLKIGDIFIRDNTCYENGKSRACNHAVLYIGNGETIESNRQNSNPHLDTIYEYTTNGIFLTKDKNKKNSRTIYDHIIRINGVLNDTAATPGSLPSIFTVGTFNIGNLDKKSHPTASEIGLKIRKGDFDVIGIQEIDKGSSISITNGVSASSGLKYSFHTPTSAGNSLLSSVLLSNNTANDLTKCGLDARRALQKTVLKVNNKYMSFYNVHLDPNPSCRNTQARDVVNIINKDSLPWVLMGDFNFGSSDCGVSDGIFANNNIVYDENYGTRCTDMIIFPKNRGIELVSSKTYRTNTTLSDHNLISATLKLN